MFQEYMQQVLAELAATASELVEDEPMALLGKIEAANRIFIAGVGRSGLIMRGFAMRLMHLGLPVHVVGHVTTPAIGQGDLLIIGSGSGATPSLLAHASRARQEGAGIVLITTTAYSPIGQLADLRLVIPAPTPKAPQASLQSSIQPMASLFEQTMLVMLDTLSILLMARLGVDDQVAFTRHANLE
jgi:6-phospho-3-hexuloisomerase